MKQRFAILLFTGMLLIFGCALAEADRFSDPIPDAVLALDRQLDSNGVYRDCILFPDTPLGAYCLVLTPSRLYGYIQKDGEWKNWAQLSSLEYQNGTQTYFRRHKAGAALGLQGACGLSYPDGTGFDLIKGYSGDPGSIAMMMQFHWKEGDFRLVGWQASATGQFVLWEDGRWVYFNSVTGERLGSARLDWLMDYGLAANDRALPLTLADAQKMEAVSRETAETLFPGWTLGLYQDHILGKTATAIYYRIEDGRLIIRRASLSSDAGGIQWQLDSMPVPLSELLLLRLQTEDAATLLDISGTNDTFLTDAFLDQAQIPIADTILQNDLQTHRLLLLTEDDNGVRRFRFVEQDSTGYTVRASQPLPDDAWLDLIHSADDIILVWNEQRNALSVFRLPDGNWSLASALLDDLSGDWTSCSFDAVFCGIQFFDSQLETQIVLVGTNPWRDLFSLDVTQLPVTIEEAAAALNREGWAVVSNPDPADRLHLRKEPNVSSESLGKFYNHTPVQVLEQQKGWVRVRIGTDGRLEGWMMDKYLAFGSAMDAVAAAYPDRILRDEYEKSLLFSASDMRENTGVAFTWYTWIVGVTGDELYIVLDTNGNTGYLPQSWFWAGND